MPGLGSGRGKKIQSWPLMPGSRKQEKTMHHHQKQRCFMLCSRHCHHASALPQRSRRGQVSRLGKFKAWVSGAATSSPIIASTSGAGRRSLWHRGTAPISTGVGAPLPTLGVDPDKTVLFLFSRDPLPPIRSVYSNPMIILTAVRRFLPLSTVRIIAWTVRGGSTPMIVPTVPAKGLAALRVAALTVGIMCAVPDPRIIAPCVTASFAVPLVNVIMWLPSNVNRSKPASTAKPSTQLSPTDATSAGTPNVPCTMNGCPSMTIRVSCNP